MQEHKCEDVRFAELLAKGNFAFDAATGEYFIYIFVGCTPKRVYVDVCPFCGKPIRQVKKSKWFACPKCGFDAEPKLLNGMFGFKCCSIACKHEAVLNEDELKSLLANRLKFKEVVE